MAQNISLWNATYSDVPAVNLPKSGGGTARFTDASITTAVEADVTSGKIFIKADGSPGVGTATGGGGGSVTQDQDGYIVLPSTGGGSPSATQHEIYFEFSDSTDVTINAWYDSSFISDAITATTPTTYGQKTVTLAQLDGVTWYEPTPIPLNTQLIDYTAVTNGYYINGGDGTEDTSEWACCSDYTKVDPTMTFSFVAYRWFDLAFYDSTKTYISGATQGDYADTIENDYAHGTLSGSRIPSNAEYVRLSSYPPITPSDPSTHYVMSLIRTA